MTAQTHYTVFYLQKRYRVVTSDTPKRDLFLHRQYPFTFSKSELYVPDLSWFETFILAPIATNSIITVKSYRQNPQMYG